MILDRYYYHQLNKAEQAVYKAFYAGVMAHQDVIPLPVKGILLQQSFERIYRALTLDNPLIYFLNQSACSIATDSCGHLAICPQYFWNEETVHRYNRRIKAYVQQFVMQLQLIGLSDYEKEKKIHDWFCQNVTYDINGGRIIKKL